MAGAGKYNFTNGSTLTASQVNTYLMDQAVMRFASATARDTAIPSPTEGMMCYLDDVNWLMVYTGSAWTITGGDKPYISISGTNTVANNSDTQIDFTGKVVTNRGSFTLSASPSAVVVPQTGLYSITAFVSHPASATGVRNPYLDINGTSWSATSPVNSASIASIIQLSAVFPLTAGNYIALRTFQTSGGSQTVTFRFVATYLGA